MLSQLPKDLKKLILFKLELWDYFKSMEVCREWHTLLHGDIYEEKKKELSDTIKQIERMKLVKESQEKITQAFTNPEEFKIPDDFEIKQLRDLLPNSIKTDLYLATEEERQRLSNFLQSPIMANYIGKIMNLFENEENMNDFTSLLNNVEKLCKEFSQEERDAFGQFGSMFSSFNIASMLNIDAILNEENEGEHVDENQEEDIGDNEEENLDEDNRN